MKIFQLLIISCLLVFGQSCNNQESGTVKKVKPGTQFTKHGEMTLISNTDSSKVKIVNIEIVETEYKRNRGLMDRSSMELNQGMLFIFEEDIPQSFWMKNTIMPLDFLFINSELNVVSHKQNAQPFSEASVTSDGIPAKYVLEINAGFLARFGFKTGDRVTFKRMSK